MKKDPHMRFYFPRDKICITCSFHLSGDVKCITHCQVGLGSQTWSVLIGWGLKYCADICTGVHYSNAM